VFNFIVALALSATAATHDPTDTHALVELYERGLTLEGQGALDEACAVYDSLRRNRTDPSAARGWESIQLLANRSRRCKQLLLRGSNASAAFVTGSTLIGFTVGLITTNMFHRHAELKGTAMAALGTLSGIGLSYLAMNRGWISTSKATAILTSQVIGVWTARWALHSVSRYPPAWLQGLMTVSGVALGMGAGALWSHFEPTNGDVTIRVSDDRGQDDRFHSRARRANSRAR
jgi:hypothetical protein